MSVLHPKTRTISFRLSESEYVLAEAISREHSFESLSVFARYAVLSFGGAIPPENEAKQIHLLTRRLDVLMEQIASLSRRVYDGKDPA